MKNKLLFCIASCMVLSCSIKSTVQQIDLSLISFPYEINASGNYEIIGAYSFQDATALALHITADDVTLLSSDVIIDGNGNLDRFVHVDGAQNVQISNVQVVGTLQEAVLINNSAHNILLQDFGAESTHNTSVVKIDDATLCSFIACRLYGNGFANLHAVNVDDLRCGGCDFSGTDNYVAEHGVMIDNSQRITVETSRAHYNQNGFSIQNTTDIVFRMAEVIQSTNKGFYFSSVDNLSLIACTARDNGTEGIVINGSNINLFQMHARLNGTYGIYIDAQKVMLDGCGSVKNELCGLYVSAASQNITLSQCQFLHDKIDAIENNCGSLTVVTLENAQSHVQDAKAMVSNVESCIGSSLDKLADLSQFDQENLTVTLDEYSSESALESIQLSMTAWEKAIYNRLLRLEFKLNQVLNEVTSDV